MLLSGGVETMEHHAGEAMNRVFHKVRHICICLRKRVLPRLLVYVI